VAPTTEHWLKGVPEVPELALATLNQPPNQRAQGAPVIRQGWREWTRQKLIGCAKFVLGTVGTVLLVLVIWVATRALEAGDSDESDQHQPSEQGQQQGDDGRPTKVQDEVEDLEEKARKEGSIPLMQERRHFSRVRDGDSRDRPATMLVALLQARRHTGWHSNRL
jgi:hypothetical protein